MKRDGDTQRSRMLERIAACVLQAEGKRAARVRVVCVTNRAIQKLNRTFRGKDVPTDVLSFDERPHGLLTDDKNFLGEVVVAPAYIRAQAREVGVPFTEELVRMTIHGTLHLLGYDHEKTRDATRMFARQEIYVAQFTKKYSNTL
ncbi:rRNA maturation RNase YbeY [Candidatus Berkelbacteria bacterium]|nr:rRNA maturation RNase YbeY [Candidatus Berkelbacteria bacterium]